MSLAQAQAVLEASRQTRWFGYIAVSMLSGIGTEEARVLLWDYVVAWTGDDWVPVTEAGFEHEKLAIYVWRSDRFGGDTKTAKSRRSLELPELCVEALHRQWDQQDHERRIMGERWQENGLVFTSTNGTPLMARNVRRAFRAVVRRAGLPDEWTPRELRHTFVSIMSNSGLPVEEISRLVGHSSTQVTETVYRHELRPVIRTGAGAVDRMFSPAPELANGNSTRTVRKPRRTTGETRATEAALDSSDDGPERRSAAI